MKSPQTSITSKNAGRISLFHATSNAASSLSLSSTRSVYHAYSKMGHGMDIEKDCVAMELGHKVCRLQLMKKWEPLYKRLSYKRETQELVLTKWDSTTTKTSKQTLDLKWIKEVQTVHYKMTQMNIEDKWKKDREVRRLDSELLLDITYGTSFVLNHMILLFENKDTCKLWNRGINYLITETQHASHCLQVERWMRKQFSNLLVSDSINSVSMKQMKPFVQVVLQYKAQAKDLQEISEGEMDYEAFASAVQRLLNFDALFDNFFNGIVKHTNRCISLDQFFSFLNKEQKDEWAANKEQTYEFLKTYLREVDLARDTVDPHLTCEEFVDYLFSSENTVFDPINNKVTHDMNQPLTNYWIASSHNTYLTGDQIKSDSSLDAYANSLMMGCRCVELDCWDGTKKTNGEPNDVVIYHGYTMTSKINLRDVLNTIKHYAFVTSEYPVILSIEDNCSVPFQRLMAQAFKECLGDLLLTSPLSKDETHLPSPAALRRRIILKHKKLRLENNNNDDDDQDILSKDSVKRGMMYLRDNTHYTWTRHVFVLFDDKLCYVMNPVDSDALTKGKEDIGDEDQQDESALKGFGIRPDEMHVTEEWYHGNIERKIAEKRLMEHKEKGDGVFLVRDGGTFIGNYTVSFLQEGHVHHIRIETQIIKGEKRFYFFEHKQMDTLYELISYYTKHYLSTSKFHTHLNTACPQPQPHLGEPWFSPKADAEKLLNTINEDGAFLIRYSQSDPSVFVLSLRVNGEIWHYRLKRDGRIFVINQTVFENLNRVVEYYKTHEFVSGVTLRFPVNEKNVGQFAQVTNSPGFYKDLADLEKETEAIALHAYSGPDSSYLCFPANAVITIVSKKNNLNNMWKGRYDNLTGLFPPEMVKELTNNGGNGSNEAVSHFTIELANTIVEKWEGDNKYGIRIAGTGQWNSMEWIIASDDDKERGEWYSNIKEKATQATNQKFINIKKEKTQNIAVELSNLVVYCQASGFNPNFVEESKFYEMCSLSETKHEKLIEKGLLLYNSRHLSRVYPQASRITSTNYFPWPMWNTGCHMVALNYQTADLSMQVNQGKFQANGRCGYILKPAYLKDENFRIDNPETVVGNFPILLKVEIIGGRQLSRNDKSKGICSPFVDVEIIGMEFDRKSYRTTSISSNGLNPVWKQSFVFEIICPEVALLKFYVEDGDFIGAKSDPFIGQAVYPVDCLRGGYRSVPLLNHSSEPQELSALLIHVEIEHKKNGGTNGSKILQPHTDLQAGRTIHGSGTYAGKPEKLLTKTESITSNNFNSSMDSPTRSPSVYSFSSTSRKTSYQPSTTSSNDTGFSQENGTKKNGKSKWWQRKKS